MINPRNKSIKLTDFNISKRFEQNENGHKIKFSMRTCTGLDQWSAPETRMGAEYKESIDYWGIGVILYYMIAKHPPFFDSDNERLINKVRNCQKEKLSSS